MIKAEFQAKWDAAERRAKSFLWIFYSSGIVAAVCAGIIGLALAVVPGLRAAGSLIIAGAAALLLAIRLANFVFWDRWLKNCGLVCAACGHVFTNHTGVPLKPHQPGLCSVCAAGGACRRTPESGKCDKCGAAAFS